MLSRRNDSTVLEEFSEAALSDCEFDIVVVNGIASVLGLDLKVINSGIANYKNEDGYFYSNYTITDTSIKLPIRDLSQMIHVGQPFKTEIDLLPPDFSQVPATAMFHKIIIHEAAIFLNRSIGGFVNGKELSTKLYNQNAFTNMPYTGYATETMQGWTKLHELKLQITHDKPLPFHMQSISIRASINEK